MYFERIKRIIYSSVGNIDYDKSIAELEDASRPDFSYIVLVVLAAFIATLGLITNSAAVIIGAMIISPIMAPIMLSGASFAIMDKRKAKTAIVSVTAGVFVAIVCGMLTVFLSPVKENTAEILARTTPNILDLFIAFFCGVAGALSVVSEKISKGVVGVAISVALMPPLCVGAFGIATSQAPIAIGGFWMFFLNMAAIFVAAFAVLSLFGYSSHFEARRAKHFGVRWLVSFGVLLLISIPLMISLREAVIFKGERSVIKAELQKSFNKDDLSILQREEVEKLDTGYKVNAFIDTVKSYDSAYIKNVEKEISKKLHTKVQLLAVQRGVLSIGNGASTQFSLLDAMRPKVDLHLKKEDDERFSKLQILLDFVGIQSYRYDKNSNTVEIDADNAQIKELSKLQKRLFEDGYKSQIILPKNSLLFEQKLRLPLETDLIKELILISEFASQNKIALSITLLSREKNNKKIEGELSKIFDFQLNSFEVKSAKTRGLKIETKDTNASEQ